MFQYVLTQHAKHVLEERKIPIEWVERVLWQPQLKVIDRFDPTLECRFSKIQEYDNRVLKVVVNHSVEPVRLVSVYFDRSMKGKL